MVDIVKSHTLMLVDLAKLKWGGGATEYRKRKKENVQQQDSILIDFLKSSQHGRQQVRQSRSG